MWIHYLKWGMGNCAEKLNRLATTVSTRYHFSNMVWANLCRWQMKMHCNRIGSRGYHPKKQNFLLSFLVWIVRVLVFPKKISEVCLTLIYFNYQDIWTNQLGVERLSFKSRLLFTQKKHREAKVLQNFEKDAEKILQFMASNGLVANPSKTEFLMLNNKDKERIRKIRVGEAMIPQTRRAKLLGIHMDDDQKWTSHYWGKNRLLPALNKRLFAIRRIAMQD